MHHASPNVSRLMSSVALTVLLALAAGGCSSVTTRDTTGSTGGLFGGKSAAAQPTTEEEWRKHAEALGERYRADPRDAAVALQYADALRHSGQRTQAAAVLQQATMAHPNDRRLLGAYGRALADVGHLPQAMDMLARAHTPEQPDWRILSAQGAVLDQMGRHDEARRYYSSALKIVPNEPSVLSNLGLSYALSRDLKQAETTLRQASASGGSDKRVRQNLALVVGLQGRFEEAEQIARADLPADEAAQNIAYLKQMLAEHSGRKGPAKRPRQRTAAAQS